MRRVLEVVIVLLAAGVFSGYALAQDLYVYPNEGQSQDQIERDKFDCYQWAKQQTGFDPMQAPQATTPPPSQQAPQGGVVRGAARGAAGGAIGGAIAGNAGKGAAIGAATGALIGGIRRSDQVRRQQYEQEQWAQQQAANYSHQRDEYNRAWTACLEAKGYTVR